jgi:hypothetical protein
MYRRDSVNGRLERLALCIQPGVCCSLWEAQFTRCSRYWNSSNHVIWHHWAQYARICLLQTCCCYRRIEP